LADCTERGNNRGQVIRGRERRQTRQGTQVSRAEQGRAGQSRAEQGRAGQSRADQFQARAFQAKGDIFERHCQGEFRAVRSKLKSIASFVLYSICIQFYFQ
jgi:hypothetical protein